MRVFTTTQVATICQVAPKTVHKWFDKCGLKGYRVPESNARRIPADALVEFLRLHNNPIPQELLEFDPGKNATPLRAKMTLYVASRASIPERSAMWRDLRDRHGWPIISTWIDEAGENETDNMSELWSRIAGEIHRSSGLLLYAGSGDTPLKGALVEVGMAIAFEKPVAIVARECERNSKALRPIGSWANHPLCSFHLTVADAWAHIQRVAVLQHKQENR